MKKTIILAFTVSGLVLASCSSRAELPSSEASSVSPIPKGVVGPRTGLVKNTPFTVAPANQGFGSFEEWKASFKARARASGVSDAVLAAADPHMRYSSRVVSSDRSQAEFVKPIWEYIDSAVGSRTSKGRSMAGQWGSTLSAVQGRFLVDRTTVMGIWGMETNFGGFTGDTNIFTSMASLAYDGRRRDFAETQLVNALRIVQRGDRSASALNGSWGGGLGQTQFIPQSYNTYALDFNGDSRVDLWNVQDALASTANFLRNEGWTPGLPWGVEVTLPANFDYLQSDYTNFRPASYWASQGVVSRSPRGLPSGELAIFLPAGHKGPAFAITRNFHVIKRYNPSDSYALAVSLVGDAAFGLPGVQASWPRYEKPLRKGDIQQAQRKLMALGYDTGGADGLVGRGTRKAVRQYQASVGMVPDGFLNQDVLQRLN